MDLILEQDKLSSLNNNNNNPVKYVNDSSSNGAIKNDNMNARIGSDVFALAENNNNNNNDNNIHITDRSPVSVSPTISETIYEFGSHFENPSHVISEKVQNLASQIYNELQKVMNRCNDDEDAVGGLMPLIVNVLESLDLALIENQQLQVELELCKDDNEQLVSAFEKEKLNKKKIEQRLFEFEFSTEEEKQQYQQRIDSLANIVKMLELKAKNSSDHSSRLEEKEVEMKKEYNKVHERYNDLLRSHVDLMERVKIMFGDESNSSSSSTTAASGQGPNLSNIAGTLRNNLQRLTSNESDMASYNESMDTRWHRDGNDATVPTILPPRVQSMIADPLSSAIPRTTWNIEAEMSYDDTTTIIEDVDELQRCNDIKMDKDKMDRDHSLSGKYVHPSEFSTNVTENLFGMEKEIENLITENNELLATKNALNIVKDDLIAKVDELQSDLAMCKNEIQQREAVQDRLKSRISQLEEEMKKSKEELDETKQKLTTMKEDDEEGVPIAQRKRFTRVEMSRVLMERNSYKEKYFELQEALRWSELSRATKNEDKRSAIWKLGKNWIGFSNFFNPSPISAVGDGSAVAGSTNTIGGSGIVRANGTVSPNSTSGGSVPAIRYSANPTATPALEAMRRRARAQQNGDLVLMMDSDLTSERTRAMKNVKAHVTRSGSGDRIQAYGWSITGASNNSSNSDNVNKSGSLKNASVPVPIYCRPLGGEDIGMKIWCATAVDLTGGEAGFPISNDVTDETGEKNATTDTIADLESEINEAMKEQTNYQNSDQHYSTFVWICSVSHSKSKVTIVNIRSNPGEVLDSFFIKTHLLCVVSVPGAKTNDLLGSAEIVIDNATAPELKLSHRKLSKSVESPSSRNNSIATGDKTNHRVHFADEVEESSKDETKDEITLVSSSDVSTSTPPIIRNDLSDPISVPARSVTLEKLTEYVAYTQPPSPTNSLPGDSSMSVNAAGNHANRTPSAASALPVQPMSTRLPTMWLGGQNGVLYVHSGIAQWSHCIATINLPDSILQIIHYRGRVFVALANGQCCIFVRSEQTGEWNFDQYYVLDIGVYSAMNSSTSNSVNNTCSSDAVSAVASSATQRQTALYSIRGLEISKDTVWLGYRNLIFIVNTRTFRMIHSFVAHPRKETYVRQLAAAGDGVWCSFRLDSTLRLYSAFRPYQHVQNIDIEPYVSKMITPKSFNFVRISSLRASNHRLWIGTSNGVILCLPCVHSTETATEAIATNSADLSAKSQVSANNKTMVRTNASTGALALGTYMPLCDVSTIQLSFHGHKDNVKFFVCTNNLILSGGEGYVDFRISDTEDCASLSKGDRSHLIVWEIN